VPKTVGGTISAWSIEWRWQERVALYADHLDTLRLEKEAREVKAMRGRYLSTFEKLHRVTEKVVDKYVEALNDPEGGLFLKPENLARLLELSIKYESALRGDPESALHAKLEFAEVQADDLANQTTPAQAGEMREASKDFIIRIAQARANLKAEE
jgi:hypothetical protein